MGQGLWEVLPKEPFLKFIFPNSDGSFSKNFGRRGGSTAYDPNTSRIPYLLGHLAPLTEYLLYRAVLP